MACRDLAKLKAYQKEYYNRPEVKARNQAYRNRPENKARRKACRNRPEAKAKMKEYRNRPEAKAKLKAHMDRPEYKAKMKEYKKLRQIKNPELFFLKICIYKIVSRNNKNHAEPTQKEAMIQTLWKLIHNTKSCKFCGDEFNYLLVHAGKKILSQPHHLPSIDRIDSKIGYTPTNIQLVCNYCNMDKKARSDKEYVNQCIKVATHTTATTKLTPLTKLTSLTN